MGSEIILETYVITYKESNRIIYVGQDIKEANGWLEMPHYSLDERKNYQLSIWEDGRLLNECITRKIKIK